MNDEIYLMPLGGGQHVGASCYYLRLGDTNIILDAGIGIENGVVFEPNTYALQTLPFLYSVGQVSQVFISHAHTDHIGYLLKLMKEANHANVYMTQLTSLLSEYQLYDKCIVKGNYEVGDDDSEYRRLAVRQMFDKITKVSYAQTLDFGTYKVTFLPAGHIPGAMMMLFECGKRKILYTGDYSLESTCLTDGCYIPEGLDIDTIIMCGLHAKHPMYKKKENQLYETIQKIEKEVKKGGSVLCHVPQLSKGIEFIKILNEKNKSHIPIYIDDSLGRLIQKLEQSGIPILNRDNHIVKDVVFKNQPHIYITSERKNQVSHLYQEMNVDFSLHEDFSMMKNFIKKLNPKHVYVVHCGKEQSLWDDTIEQVIMRDGECRTQFTFAEDGALYKV